MSNTKKYRTFLLSKKRWHVGLPENIARVKRDEMEQEMEQEKMKKNSIAMEQEHRLEVLRSQRSKMQINQTIVDITKRSSSPSDEDVSQSKLKSTPPLWTFKDLNEIPWYTKSRFKEENHSRIQNMEDPLNDRLYTDTKSDTEKLGEDIMCIIDEKKSSSEEQKSDQDSFQDIIELKAIDGENSEIVLGDCMEKVKNFHENSLSEIDEQSEKLKKHHQRHHHSHHHSHHHHSHLHHRNSHSRESKKHKSCNEANEISSENHFSSHLQLLRKERMKRELEEAEKIKQLFGNG